MTPDGSTVQTARGPVDAGDLGSTLMHEHVFILNEEIRQNYPGDWDEEKRVADAISRLQSLKAAGVDTIADPTVIGLGRCIPRIQRVAAQVDLNIVVAAGVYTYNEVPLYFRYRAPDSGASGQDPMTEMFVADITEGIAGTGVKAAFLKCAIDEPGLTPGVERVMRAVGAAHRQTGAPITVHTHPGNRSGLTALRVLREEGVDLTKVVLGHSGDSDDIRYLTELAESGVYLGMDRFGLDILLPFERRVATMTWLCQRGYADKMVLSHDAACFSDWFPPGAIEVVAPRWHYHHIGEDVLPALRDRGVTDAQVSTMLVANPRRYFTPAGTGGT
jgi:phosphotriesterase-related protein